MRLVELQGLFFGALRGEVSPDEARVSQAFVGDARLDAGARLNIYAEMYWSRQVEALQAEFPMVHALLGDCAFADLAREYVRAHPSGHPDISQLGRNLPAFIATHPGIRGDLAELAALERARSVAFGAPDVAPCAWEELAAFGQDAFAGTRLAFVPALQTLSASFDLKALWAALREGEKPAPVRLEAPATTAIWKSGFDVFHASLARCEAAALALARRGATLAGVCECFAGEPEPAAAAFQAIASWFNEGWVASIAPPELAASA